MTDERKDPAAATVNVERIGGFAGFGGAARIRSHGSLHLSDLSRRDRDRLDRLMAEESPANPMPDEFLYRITRQVGTESITVEVPESRVPEALRACVRDELM